MTKEKICKKSCELDPDKKHCVTCLIENCETCSKSNPCFRCKPGYILHKNQCIKSCLEVGLVSLNFHCIEKCPEYGYYL